MNAFLIDLVIAVLAFILFKAFIDDFVNDPQARNIFTKILIIACILFALFGTFLPIH